LKPKTVIIFLIIAVALAFLSGCDKINKCQNIDCFTPPQPFIFNIVDASTGENVFAGGAFNKDDVEVYDENDRWENHMFDTYADSNYLVLPEIGWETKRTAYTIHLGEETEINLVLDMQERHENCCTFFSIEDFSIEDYPWSEIDSTGVIQVEI
jgi:hypothetical protein